MHLDFNHYTESGRLMLFCTSGVTFIGAITAILLGILCRVLRLHPIFKFQNHSYKVLQGEVRSVFPE